jgi:carotenoid cleavage dioxygenase-like enzyme
VAFIPDTDPTSPSWVHDLAATDNYAVILETPLLFNMPSLIFGGGYGHVSEL